MKNSFKQTIYLLLSFLLSGLLNVIYTQEEECGDVKKRFDWFYVQRAYPYDTIPSNALADAINQRDALIAGNGFQFSIPAVFIGPQPYYGIGGPNSGRVKAVKYDPRDASGNTIYAAGNNGGIFKTTDG